MTFDYDKFMKGVGLYEEANRRRDNLEFDFAFSLYERAQEFLFGRVDIPLFYDMALAADLSGDFSKASEYFDKSCASLEQMKADNPHDERINNLQPLVDSLAHQLSVRKMADNNATDYVNQIQPRVWAQNKFPLTIWIADKESHNDGFDKGLCDLIFDAFRKWSKRCQWFQIARANKADEGIAKIVVKKASPGDLQSGSGGQTNFAFNNAGELVRVDIRVYVPSSNFQSLILHEAGHALGIDGHSPYADDLMWWKSPLIEISDRDVETMKIIYGQ
jgi:predicted Zn-dependent protease